MSMNELESKVNELRELRRMADELAAEITAAEDGLKAYMTANQADELHGPSFKITWKTVTGSRLDSKALKSRRPGTVAEIRQADHHPPLHRGTRKAPCITADQSTMQRA